MAVPRRQMNATLLADGTVLATGGSNAAGFNTKPTDDRVLAAERWDPATERWTALARQTHYRLYHSTALLLPGARVLSVGSGQPAATGLTDDYTGEVFSPPYLFKLDGSPAVRPTFSGAPDNVGYGASFPVNVTSAAPIAKVTCRLSTATDDVRAATSSEPAGECVDDLLGDAVGEVFLVSLGTHVAEREHGDRAGDGCARGGRHGGGRGGGCGLARRRGESAANAAAVETLASGSGASERATAAPPPGTSVRLDANGGADRRRCASSACGVGSVNGGPHASISFTSQPSERCRSGIALVLSRGLLGAHVRRRCQREAGSSEAIVPGLRERAGDAEVRDERVPGGQQDVLRLEVAMDDATAVSVMQCIGDLARDPNHVLKRQAPFAGETITKGFAVHVRHRVPERPAVPPESCSGTMWGWVRAASSSIARRKRSGTTTRRGGDIGPSGRPVDGA